MKRERAHIVFSWLLLAIFTIAQLPFSLLHHHTHNAPCALVADEQHDHHGNVKAHFHTYENSECFVCSGYLLKKDYTTTFTVHVSIEELALPTRFTAIPELVIRPVEHGSSRAPPFIS